MAPLQSMGHPAARGHLRICPVRSHLLLNIGLSGLDLNMSFESCLNGLYVVVCGVRPTHTLQKTLKPLRPLFLVVRWVVWHLLIHPTFCTARGHLQSPENK
jgi:hypothetical protein